MATIPLVSADANGTNLTPTGATAGPDTIAPSGSDVIFIVHNGGGVTTSPTVAVPGNTEWGVAAPDIPTGTAIPAGAIAVYRLPARLADPETGLIGITTTPTTSVNLYAVRAK
jgi:hypothetical protein